MRENSKLMLGATSQSNAVVGEEEEDLEMTLDHTISTVACFIAFGRLIESER